MAAVDDVARALQEQIRGIRSLPPEDRALAILASEAPAPLVRALPAQDLYLTLAASDNEDALALLPFTTRAQVDFVLDIDAWDHDQLDLDRAGRWLDLLHQADPALVVRFLRESEEETVVLTLAKMLFVTKLDESISIDRWPPEDRPAATLDGLYFLEPQDDVPDAAFAALWEGLARFREENRMAYDALLERVLWILPAEQEEGAYERRVSRLAESGFPPQDEALEVWAPGHLAEATWRAKIAERLHALPLPRPSSLHDAAIDEMTIDAGDEHDESESAVVPVAALPLAASAHDLALIGAGAAYLDDAKRAAIAHALVRLGNRFAVTSRGHLGDPKTHRDGLVTALCHVRLGLDELGVRDAREAARAMAQLPVADLCRVGTGAIIERAARARAVTHAGWLAKVPHGRARLEDVLDTALDGLLGERPRFTWDDEERPFRSREDLEVIDDVLGVIDGLGHFVTVTLGVTGPGDVPELDPLPDRRREASECLWSEIAATALAQASLGRPLRPQPIGKEDARRALAHLLTPEVPRAPTELAWRLAKDAGLGAAAAQVLARIESDAAELPEGTLPDTRYFRAFLFRL